jgi:predicted dehydrogenase
VTLRGALIGCGHVSERQLRAWRKIETAQIVAVADLDGEKARRRAREFDVPAAYTDYQRMLDELELDFVDIATRPSTHPELVMAAAARGLHVLCQKPLTDTLAESRRMVSVCEEAGVTLMVNENARHQAWFRRLKALLEESALGDPYYARFEMRRRWSLPEPSFDNQPYFQEMPNLVVYEMGVHFLDTARYLFGEAETVYAKLKRISPHIAGEDVALLVADFDDLSCLIDTSWCSVPEPGPEVPWGPVRVEGRAGTASLGHDGVLRLYNDDGQRSWAFSEDTIAEGFTSTQRHFIECLRTGRSPETSGVETLKTMALVFAAYRSADEGRPIRAEEVLSETRS